MLAFIGVGEGSNIFGPGKVLSQDVRAVLGNAAGGLLAASVSPNSLDTEMGSCNPEQPIKGSTLCSTCNDDPLRLCTPERCRYFLETAFLSQLQKEIKLSAFLEIVKILAIRHSQTGRLAWYIDTDLNGRQALTIQNGNIVTKMNNGNAIPYNTNMIVINLTTDKPAMCRYILDEKSQQIYLI